MPLLLTTFVHLLRRRSWLASIRLPTLLLLVLIAGPSIQAKGPEPPQRIPLDTLGFRNISARYLLTGASMFTLDYVDNQHLLLTFGVSRLMPRIAGDPPDDEDHMIAAVLLELPSGREIARTEWRFHDLGQYLWNLGNGHFMVRRRNLLTTFSPLLNLAQGKPFSEETFLKLDRKIDAIQISADHDLLSIYTSKEPPPNPEAQALASAQANAVAQFAAQTGAQTGAQTSAQTSAQTGTQPNPQPTTPTSPHRVPHDPVLLHRDPSAPRADPYPIQINFIRLVASPDVPDRVLAQHAGLFPVEKHIVIPLTADGFLRIRGKSGSTVLMDFVTFTGDVTDLGDYNTSCSISPTFVSHSEFVTFGCRGSDDKLQLAGFNIHGDLMWVSDLDDAATYPFFEAAPTAGRFAFSHTLISSTVFDNETPSTDQLVAQEVRVVQTYNGKQLLRAYTSPIQRSGQNFALSPDGLSLAVIHDPTIVYPSHDTPENVVRHPVIEIYKLPPLSDKDRQQTQVEAALAPPSKDVPVQFSSAEMHEIHESEVRQARQDLSPGAPILETNPSQPTATAKPSEAASASPADPNPDQPAHRKPPSLFGPPPDAQPVAPPAASNPTSPPL